MSKSDKRTTSRRAFLQAAGMTALAAPGIAGMAAERGAHAGGLPRTSAAAATTPSTFQRFIGTCQGTDTASGVPLIGGMAWDRTDVYWSTVQPTSAPITQTALDALKTQWTDAASAGVNLLPILDYTAPWAATTAAYSFTKGSSTYSIGPVLSSTDTTFTRNQTITDSSGGQTTSTITVNRSITPPASTSQWTAYVDAVVGALYSVGVRHFQVWNEAFPASGFWYSGMQQYFDEIHKPAAQVIRGYSGAKVVYGGWPSIGGIDNYIAVLDKYSVWGDVDVFDMHYYQPDDMETLRAAAPAAYANPPIWQTENGYTSDSSLVSRTYPRVFRWALDYGLRTDPDHHKLFWFAWTGHGSLCLWDNGAPTAHGASIQTLSALLPGTAIAPFTAFTTTPSLTFNRDATQSSVEGFAVGSNEAVLAVHLVNSGAPSSVGITFSSVPSGATVSRVSILGVRTPLSWSSTGHVSVPVADPDSASATINKAAPTTTFYVKVTW